MAARYSRQHILEKLEFWKKELAKLDESTYNRVIDALVVEFGRDVVFSTKLNYTLTQQDLKKVFKILNQHLFSGRIKTLPVVLWDESKLLDKLNYHAKMSGDVNKGYDSIDCLGVHSAITVDVYDGDEIVDVKFRDDYLIINSSRVKNDVFIFVVAVICHEMIHVYDQQYSSETHDMMLEWEQYHKTPPKFHATKIFGEKMEEANENGINVVENLSSDNTRVVDNMRARYVLKKVVGESENPDVEILQSEHDVFFHNKKTGMGFFAHFD